MRMTRSLCPHARRLLLAAVLFEVASVAFLGGSSRAVFGSGGVIVVEAGQSIAQAVNRASVGDTIFVKNGHYSESSIVVGKSVSIVGESAESTVVDGGTTAQVLFQVVASNVLIENFTLQNTSTGPFVQAPAVRVYGASGVTVLNVTVLSAAVGIEIRSSNSTEIAYCTISESSSAGIYLRESSVDNIVVGSTVANCTRGIVFADTASQFNRIYHDNFDNNTQQVSSFGGVNYFDDGYPSGGNYWSDYLGVDLKSGVNQDQSGSDGILDQGFAFDKYPLANPVTNIDILELGHDFIVEASANINLTAWSFDVSGKSLDLFVGGKNGNASVVRMEIPKDLLSCENSTGWVVSFYDNGSRGLQYLGMEDAENTYLYFTFSGMGEGEIQITGTKVLVELSLPAITVIFLAVTILVRVLTRKRSRGESVLAARGQ